MIKRLFFSLAIFHIAVVAIAQKNQSFYLYAHKDFPVEVQSDILYLLGKATGEKWQTASSENYAYPGIILKIAEDGAFKTK